MAYVVMASIVMALWRGETARTIALGQPSHFDELYSESVEWSMVRQLASSTAFAYTCKAFSLLGSRFSHCLTCGPPTA